MTNTDATPYVDTWGNRYSTPDAPHSAPGDLVYAPRETVNYGRAVVGFMGSHIFFLPAERYTQADRYALTRLMFEATNRPINPAVLTLPHDEMTKTFSDYSYRCTGRYTGVEVTTTNHPDRIVVGYRTDTSGGGGYPPEMIHHVTRDDLKAAVARWYEKKA